MILGWLGPIAGLVLGSVVAARSVVIFVLVCVSGV